MYILSLYVLYIIHLPKIKNYGSIFITSSSKLEIIGIDIDTIIILLPSSILLAIALSPESLQILTANSAKKAIPVILTNKLINSVLIDALLAIDFINERKFY